MTVQRHSKTHKTKQMGESAGAHPRPKETVTWDSEVAGLGERVRGDSHTWIVQMRVEGKTRKRTLGDVGTMDRALARDLARSQIEGAAQVVAIRCETPTLRVYAKRFLAERSPSWKPATIRSNTAAFDTHILPALGSYRLEKITAQDVRQWYAHLAGAAGSSNRSLAVLSSAMSHAEILGLRPVGSNPCKGLRRRNSKFKATYLNSAEWRALGAALNAFEPSEPIGVALLRFLALTGCRRGEAAGLRWSMIEHRGKAGSVAVLPDSKTGPKIICLPTPVVALLREQPRISGYVFPHVPKRQERMSPALVKDTIAASLGVAAPSVADDIPSCGTVTSFQTADQINVEPSPLGAKQDGACRDTAGERTFSITNLDALWRKMRDHASLPNLRIHDLRHNYASFAINAGISLQTIGGLLGHAELATTEGYAHLQTKPVEDAAARMGDYFEGLDNGGKRKRARRVKHPVKCPYRAFLNSKQSRAAFCAARGYDEEVFGEGLRAWRKAEARARS